uniref:Uncharacterized protein n=1 Tax=Candidatus Kentrum eta TaxID=2126337 RepID=A0A450UZ51_9GAMM|nr:MAG: hypothetical protein BECKH772A_GA0070896_100175 [Candidatus Kentron sp. H]VFJ91256.1 MAG: hypothetical protein BECKH772B_GA0070898_100165 [Candidatus Kentron sp. H]VFJ97802.1 MAG: hypothetical protein BECKH772C_GA0070978_100165 [Candidatus Kentron sp. H]
MIEILKKLDPNWIGAIAAIVGILIATLLGLEALELIPPVFAIGGIIVTLLASVVLFVYWVREQTKEKQREIAPSPEPEMTGQCFVEIHGAGFRHERECQIDSNALAPLPGGHRKVGEVIESILSSGPEGPREDKRFDDPFQLALGAYLLEQVFPAFAAEFTHGAPPTHVDVYIHARDPRVLLLPWHVLSQGDVFLSSFLDWTVSVSGMFPERPARNPCPFPASPRVLLVIPESKGRAATDAKAHLEELENELSIRNPGLTLGQGLRVADSWAGFPDGLERFRPDVVYCHGSWANDVDARMAGGEVNAEDLATAIGKCPQRPALVYLNGFGGPGAGLARFGMALEESVPAVIVGRSPVSPVIAREQGLKLLIDILTQAIPPHRAVARLFGRLEGPATTARARWMTPLLFRGYSEWNAEPPPEPPARGIHDPHWHLKIDRVSQFSTVTTQTLQMAREGRPRSLAFVWYGAQGQGIGLFHQRLNVELREYLPNFNAHLHEIRPDWPSELEDPDMAFRDCLTEAFGVKYPDDIPRAIRKLTQGASGRQTLVYVRHAPVISSRLINPKSLKGYLAWWDRAFAPLLERNQFLLLGISFVVKNPAKFRGLVLEKDRLEDLALKHTVFRLLDEMEELAQRDIADFFKTHNIRLPMESRDRIIEKVLEETGGHYEKTVDQLRDLVAESWHLREDKASGEASVEEDYDY